MVKNRKENWKKYLNMKAKKDNELFKETENQSQLTIKKPAKNHEQDLDQK